MRVKPNDLTPERLVRAVLAEVTHRALAELERINNPGEPLSDVEFPMGTGSRDMKIRELLGVIPYVIRAAEQGDPWGAAWNALLAGARYDFKSEATGDVIDLKRVFERDRPHADRGRTTIRAASKGGLTGGKRRRGPPGGQLAVEVKALLERSHGVSRTEAIRRVGARHNLSRTVMYERLKEAPEKTVG